ncbi:MAG: L-ribulose-5-phosphate 3-epimerase [Clostridiaceae bacterium]|jgi:L-ribulose-5-phosphate 3-epimerase|nr:L-ribulose-5-phosphate 3-epimerase [Clostridiaceae bacterium]
MKFSLGVYEKAMPESLSWEKKLTSAKLAGFDRVEISIDETDKKLARLYEGDGFADHLVDLQRKTGVTIRTMCLSGHRRFPLGSHFREIRDKSMEIMKKAIEFSDKVGIRIIQLAGYDVYYNETSSPDSKKYFTENVIRSVEYASKYGVILAFETMENDFMNTIEKAMEYVKLVDSPYLQVYPDIGNVTNGAEDAVYDIKCGKGHIVAAHLKETKPKVFRNMRFGEGHVDFASAIKELKKQGVNMYTAEFWHDEKRDYLSEMKYAYSFLEPFLQEG